MAARSLLALPAAAAPGGGGNVIPRQPLPTEFRVFASGKVETTKGTFLFDDEAAKAVMTAWKSYGNDIQIDYEHKSVDPASRAGDGLAAGWCRLAVRNGELWAVSVRWTSQVAEQIAQGAWKYISPTFDYDHKTGRISELLNIALTNIPATKKLPPLVAAGRFMGGATPYMAAPIVDVKWDADAAVKRLRAWAGVDKDNPPASAWRKYAQGFAWVDPKAPTNFASYKLPHHDIVGGKFVVVRQGVIAAGSALAGARGGVSIPEKDIRAVKSHLAAHYHAMKMTAPWEPKNEPAHTSAADKETKTMATKASKKNARLGMKKTKKTVTEVTEQDDAAAEAADAGGSPGKDIQVDELDEADEADEMDEADEADETDEADEDCHTDEDSDDDADDSDDADDGDDSQYTDELDEADEADEADDAPPPPPPPPSKKGKAPGPSVPAKKMKKCTRAQLERVYASAARQFGVSDPRELEGRMMGAAMQRKTIESLSRQVAQLNANARAEGVKNAVENAIKCGKLTPAQRDQFVALGMKSPKTLKGLLSTMPKRVSIGGGQPPHREAGVGARVGKVTLSATEAEIARRSGGFDEYVKAKEAGALLPLSAFTDGDELN